MSIDTPECHSCKQPVTEVTPKCTNCGALQYRTAVVHALARDDPFVAFLLAVVFPGLGHLYTGDAWQAAIFAALTLIMFLLPPFGFPVAVLLWAVSVYDVLDQTA